MARVRKKSPDTENEKLRRRIKNRALAASYRHLREKYREEWGQLRLESERESYEGESRSTAYYRAMHRLRDRHYSEYTTMLVLFNERFQAEEGYKSNSHIGMRNLIPNAARNGYRDGARDVA
jgi:hypothetical protein